MAFLKVFSFFLASISVLCGTGCIFFVVFTSYISSGRCTIMENFILPSVPRVFVCGQRCTKGKRLSEHKRAQSVKECLGFGQYLEEEKKEGRNQVIYRPKWINFYGKRPKYIMF